MKILKDVNFLIFRDFLGFFLNFLDLKFIYSNYIY